MTRGPSAALHSGVFSVIKQAPDDKQLLSVKVVQQVRKSQVCWSIVRDKQVHSSPRVSLRWPKSSVNADSIVVEIQGLKWDLAGVGTLKSHVAMQRGKNYCGLT